MPHKHKRRRTDEVASFDLPPTTIAKPLPALPKTGQDDKTKRKVGKKRALENANGSSHKVYNDTPRAFARLLNFQMTGRRPAHVLDDGTHLKGKKRKRDANNAFDALTNTHGLSFPNAEGDTASPPTELRILRGERQADFSARVDQALPIVGLRTKGPNTNLKIPGVKMEERKTKHNRRLERMQQQWREIEARRKEKLEAEMEDKEEEREEQQLLWHGAVTGGKKKKKKMGRGGKGAPDEGDDPWAELEKRRRDTKQKSLQDVVQAPPQLKGVGGRLKLYGHAAVDVENVPGSVGSLRKREELGSVRRKVIDEYRKMMKRKNSAIEA